MESIFTVDDREPPEIATNIESWCKHFEFKAVVEVMRLEIADVQYHGISLKDNSEVIVLQENKRISTNDFASSLYDGRIKSQFKSMYNTGYPWRFSIIGNTMDMKRSLRRALSTIEEECRAIGGIATRENDDSMSMHGLVQYVQMLNGRKKIVLKPGAIPVMKDDTILSSMMRPFKGFDEDAGYLTSGFTNFLDMFYTENELPLLSEIGQSVEAISLRLSNEIRKNRNKKQMDKPLEKVENLVRWFFKGVKNE